MHMHIGGDTAVDMRDVVAVFDMDNTTVTKRGREFLARAGKRGEITDITEDLPKSYIITEAKGVRRVYISSLAPHTIVKRMKVIKPGNRSK